MWHRLLNSRADWIKWRKTVEVENSSGQIEAPDLHLREEIRTGGEPVSYPCVAVSMIEFSFDRMGDTAFKMWDYVYLTEFTEGFDPNAEYKAQLAEKEAKRQETLAYIATWTDEQRAAFNRVYTGVPL